MQLFPCPFCGPRDETEFHFGAEAGKTRPEPAGDVSPERWAEYLYMKKNPKGVTSEVWMHTTCGEFFLMERDTVSHEVTGARALGGEP